MRGPDIGSLVDTICNDLRCGLGGKIGAGFIVSIQHGILAFFLPRGDHVAEPREEQALHCTVLLHRMVVIQVILGQIRKDCGAVVGPLYPALLERMGGYFHYTALHALKRHMIQAALKLQRFLCRTGHPIALTVIPHLDCTDQAGLHPMILHDPFNQIRSRGLAVGTGDADQLHPAAR